MIIKYNPSLTIIFLVLSCLWISVLAEDSSIELEATVLAKELEYIDELDAAEAMVEYQDLTRDLQKTFREFVLELPPMTPAEVDLLYANFIELNLGYFITQRVLRSRMNPAEEKVEENVLQIRTRILEKIKELRVKRSSSTTKTPEKS